MTDSAFTRMFRCRYPLQLASMGGSASPTLPIAVSNAGGLGMLSGTVGGHALAAQLEAVPDGLPIGVNFLMPFLDMAAVAIAAERTALVEFFWGEPDGALVDAAHAGGARAAWQVGSVDEALAAVNAGCDVVVAQGVAAGGHVRGTTPWRDLLAQVRPIVEGPLVIGGGIGTRSDVVAALEAGADAVRIGTRFLAAAESPAHPDYVDRLIEAKSDDTVLTTAFGDGWPDAPHRVLASCVEAGEARGARQSWAPDWPTADFDGDVSSRALYAGQSVGAVRARQPAAEIVAELMGD